MSILVGTVAGTIARWWEGPPADTARIVTPQPSPWTHIANVLDGIGDEEPVFVWQGFEYPAEGFGMGQLTMDESCAIGKAEGIKQIQQRPVGSKVVLVGYSQGAIVVYQIAHEFLPGGALEDYQLVCVVNYGDPTCPQGTYPDGYGITRYVWDPRLLPVLHSFGNVGDMYPRAAEDTYLHIGFLALKGLALNFGDLLKVMMAMIQNDEFVDALVELLDPLTPGLLDAVVELTGLSKTAAQTKIDTKTPVSGGILGSLTNSASGGVGIGSLLNGIPILGMGTGFLGGFLGGLSGLGQFGQIVGGLLGGGSGSGGTNAGWVKMGKTFAALLNFASTNAHYRYGDPSLGPQPGVSYVDLGVRTIWELPAHL